LPKSVGRRWKILLLRAFGAKVAWTANVYSSATVFKPWLLEMDEYACLAGGVDCYNAAPVKVGAYAVVSQRAFLCTAGHDITDPLHRQTEAPITIGPRAWVCAEAYVGMGVTVGEGAVVAARAVAVHDVAPWNVVGGNPAKYIKMRMLKEFNRGGVKRFALSLFVSPCAVFRHNQTAA
jgi:putative colanic acid biosynthesis acetyltransferase WcaF